MDYNRIINISIRIFYRVGAMTSLKKSRLPDYPVTLPSIRLWNGTELKVTKQHCEGNDV